MITSSFFVILMVRHIESHPFGLWLLRHHTFIIIDSKLTKQIQYQRAYLDMEIGKWREIYCPYKSISEITLHSIAVIRAVIYSRIDLGTKITIMIRNTLSL